MNKKKTNRLDTELLKRGVASARPKRRRSTNCQPPSTRARARARDGVGNQRPWPADKVERWAIERLIPYAKNARTHTDAQVAAIAASIKEWGWTSPALVGEDGGLIASHARVLAARQLGIAEIPVMVAAGWSEAQKRAYVLADNQLAITGSGWDPELLRLELGELKLSGFDLSLTGFGDLELKDIMADRTAGLTETARGPGKRIQLRTRRRPAPPIPGWDRKCQHLGYCPRVNAKLPRRFPSAQTLDLYRVTNSTIKLNHFHPPPSAITPKGYLLP
jgi:hypothetical protein